ncbi:MutS protein 1, partial [Coemansia sp. Benny D115]
MGLAASCRHRGQLLLRLNSNCARPAPALLTPAALPSGIPRQQQQQQQVSISTASLARRRLQRTPARQCRLELHSQSLHDTTSALPAIEDDNPEDPAAAEGEDIPETTADENAENADYLKSRVVNTSSVLITVRECRQKYPNSVLLVRVGDFYELYFDQADSIGGHILGLQVVDKKFRNGTVRFTGFPARSLLRYIEILVARNGLSVALCEQFMQPLGRSFTRRVTRVITPGTLIDDQCLANTKVHNYILCVSRLNLKDIEHAARIDRWHRDKAEAERKYAKDTAKAIAVARREWEAQVAAAQEQPVKRKPGRPPKNKPVDPPKRKPGRPPKNPPSALAAVPAREFDPSTVVLPDPPVIPPEPVSIYLTEHIGSSNGEPIDLPLGLAWLDVATGDFMTSISSAESLSADLARIRPTEILYNKDDSLVAALMQSTNTTKHLSTPPISSASTSAALGFGKPSVVPVADKSFHEFLHSDSFKSITTRFEPSTNMNSDSSNAYFNISAPSSQLVSSPEHLLLEASDLTEGEKAAACALLNYILVTQLGLLPPLQPPTRFKTEGHMRMSAATIQALEVLRPLRPEQGNSDLSLLGEIDNTRTNAGARLLAKRLASPSTDLETIEKRLDLVEFFSLSARTRDAVYEHMDKIGDIERALNKLSLNCGGPHDLLEIARTLRE